MSAHSSRRRRGLVFLIASGIATAGLVLASASWARLPQASTASASGGSTATSPGQRMMPGRGRKLVVTITPSRPADAAGWYRSPVTFTTTGTDPRGGAVTCNAPQTYIGPDVSHVAIVGTCTDAQGRSQSTTFD